MNVHKTDLAGVLVIEPDRFGDHRGFFAETYSHRAYAEFGINSAFVQDNHSLSASPGTVRGLHFQAPRMRRPSWYAAGVERSLTSPSICGKEVQPTDSGQAMS